MTPVYLTISSCELRWVQNVAGGDPDTAGLDGWCWLHTGKASLDLSTFSPLTGDGWLRFHTANHLWCPTAPHARLVPTAPTITAVCLDAINFVNLLFTQFLKRET